MVKNEEYKVSELNVGLLGVFRSGYCVPIPHPYVVFSRTSSVLTDCNENNMYDEDGNNISGGECAYDIISKQMYPFFAGYGVDFNDGEKAIEPIIIPFEIYERKREYVTDDDIKLHLCCLNISDTANRLSNKSKNDYLLSLLSMADKVDLIKNKKKRGQYIDRFMKLVYGYIEVILSAEVEDEKKKNKEAEIDSFYEELKKVKKNVAKRTLQMD